MAALQPHRRRYWLNARPDDPVEFQQQVEAVCDCYQAAPRRLETEGIHTVSVDEKTGIQALERVAAAKPMRPGQVELAEWERSIPFGSRGDPCCSRKCLLLKMVPASRLAVRT